MSPIRHLKTRRNSCLFYDGCQSLDNAVGRSQSAPRYRMAREGLTDLTPRKNKEDCVACGRIPQNTSEKRSLDSVFCHTKNLPQLLQQSGGVKYVFGLVCLCCESSLSTLHYKVESFASMCHETAVKFQKAFNSNQTRPPRTSSGAFVCWGRWQVWCSPFRVRESSSGK